MNKRLLYSALFLLTPMMVFGMHIAEGFLPVGWCAAWWTIYIPFLLLGLRKVKKICVEVPSARLLYAVVAAFVFVLSSFKLPSIGGSSSHLTGIALGAILFGASTMSVVGLIVLLFQALFLAHGGLTTLGANAFSMSVVGAFVAIGVFRITKLIKLPRWLQIFLTAFISDVLIYACTSAQLSLAFKGGDVSWIESFIKFASVLVVTQIPLAVVEGILTVWMFNLISKWSVNELHLINPSLINEKI